MTVTDTNAPTSYGGWRERKGFGVAGMDGPRTAVAIGGVVLALLVGMFSSTALLVILPMLAVTGALALGSIRGEPVLDLVRRHAAWHRANRAGWTAHRAGQGRSAAAAWTLPGPLASTVLVAAEDEHARPWACVWDRRSGRLTATLLVAPSSTWLVESAQADSWVASWHSWLAKLGFAPMVVHVAVTVETTPASPRALQAAVRPRIDPDAPSAARAVLEDLIEAAPAAAASVATRVSVTVDPARATVRLESLEEQVAEFSRLLSGLSSTLVSCGVAVLRRATVTDTVAWVRAAFDPAARDALASGGPADATWAEARPVAAQESWDQYRADSGTSVTWAWDEAPRQAVPADVLSRLIGPGRYEKRVTLLITPTPAAQAARELDLQAQAAAFRSQVKRKSGRDETARDAADRERAMQAAAEEARGAGLVGLQLYATVTVSDDADLAAAVANTEHRADESRIRLRRLYGSQASGFATGLNCGVNPDLLRGQR